MILTCSLTYMTCYNQVSLFPAYRYTFIYTKRIPGDCFLLCSDVGLMQVFDAVRVIVQIVNFRLVVG